MSLLSFSDDDFNDDIEDLVQDLPNKNQQSTVIVKNQKPSSKPPKVIHRIQKTATNTSFSSIKSAATSKSKFNGSKISVATRDKLNSVSQRVASAKRKRQSELSSINEDLVKKNEELKRELRLHKQIAIRQGNSLKKYENVEEDLPRLLDQHAEQRRVDKANLRKAKEYERRLLAEQQSMIQELSRKDKLISRMKAMQIFK